MNRADARKFARPLWKRLGEQDPRSYAQFEQLVRKLGPEVLTLLEAEAGRALAEGRPIARRADGEPRTLGGTFLRLARGRDPEALVARANAVIATLTPEGRCTPAHLAAFEAAAAAYAAAGGLPTLLPHQEAALAAARAARAPAEPQAGGTSPDDAFGRDLYERAAAARPPDPAALRVVDYPQMVTPPLTGERAAEVDAVTEHLKAEADRLGLLPLLAGPGERVVLVLGETRLGEQPTDFPPQRLDPAQAATFVHAACAPPLVAFDDQGHPAGQVTRFPLRPYQQVAVERARATGARPMRVGERTMLVHKAALAEPDHGEPPKGSGTR